MKLEKMAKQTKKMCILDKARRSKSAPETMESEEESKHFRANFCIGERYTITCWSVW
jgi:hypothetical protein